MKAIYYKTSNGLVTKCIESTPEIIEENKDADEDYIEGELDVPTNYIIVNGVPVAKQQIEPVVTGNVISNIPTATWVTINFQTPVQVNDGSIELTASYPQSILVGFYNELYIPTSITVNV